MDYAITLVAALLLGVGFVFQQQTAEAAPQAHFLSVRLFADLFRRRKWVAGIVCMILGLILSAWSIGHLSLSFVEPLLTTNLLVALILAVPLSHQPVRVTEVAGALLLIAGETILSLARSIQPIGQSFRSPSGWLAAAGIAFIAFTAVQAGRHRSGNQRATLTGLGAGLVFGIQDALTRQTLQILQTHGISGLLHSWSAYCLVATGAVGILLMQSAFNAGPLHSSLPTITAAEPVAGILLGIVVFGDGISLSPASLAMHAGGLFTLVVGVVLVARAPALSNLRKAVTEPLPRLRDTGPHRMFHHASSPGPGSSGPGSPRAGQRAGGRAGPPDRDRAAAPNSRGPGGSGNPARPPAPGRADADGAAAVLAGPRGQDGSAGGSGPASPETGPGAARRSSGPPGPDAAGASGPAGPNGAGAAEPPGLDGPAGIVPAPVPSSPDRNGNSGFARPAEPPAAVPPEPPR